MAAKHPKKDSLNGFVSRATRFWQKKQTKKTKKDLKTIKIKMKYNNNDNKKTNNN